MRTAVAAALLVLIAVAVLVKTWGGPGPAGEPGAAYAVEEAGGDAATGAGSGAGDGDRRAGAGSGSGAGAASGAAAADVAEGRRLLAEAQSGGETGGDAGAVATKRHEARLALSRAMAKGLAGAPADAVRVDLARLFDQTIRLDRELPGVTFRHRVAPGERLWNLCVKADSAFRRQGAQLEPGFVLWVNGVSNARALRAGMTLTVPIGSFRLVVDKSRYSLRVFYGDGFVKEYPVGLGRDGKTPEGEFVVETKLEKPEWTSPQGTLHAFGDPLNPLGTRWLGFKSSPSASGYGIHGTDDPGSIGANASNGCVRMLNADVEELFSWVPRGTTVLIRP